MDDVLESFIFNHAEVNGGAVLRRGVLSGDDGETALHQRVAMNVFNANDSGVATLGGLETGGNFKVQFADAESASEYAGAVRETVLEFRSLLRTGGSDPDTDIAEKMLKQLADAFGGTLTADANFSGDDLADAINFGGPNSIAVTNGAKDGVDGDGAIFGGRDTTGGFRFDFADAETAEAFVETAKVLLEFTADVL